MRYNIAYITSTDPKDRGISSGVHYYQSRALQEHCGEVHYLGPVKSLKVKILKKIFNGIRRIIPRKKFKHSYNLILSKLYGRIFSEKLKDKDYDFVFADKMAPEIAFLKTHIPIIYSTDATFKLLHNYYPGYTNLIKLSIHEGHKHTQLALANASLVICTSQWAANSVINDYGFPAAKVHVLARGANINAFPDKNRILKKSKTDTCRLLFMGREWKRKGYDIAYRAMDYIRSRGVNVKLIVIGFTPPTELKDNDVEVIPYLDKNTKEGREQFDQIMFESDIYILPTRAECLAITICEAAAYGLPVITTDTGGVTEIIKDGINGYALNYDATPKEYGDKIIEILNSDTLYYSLKKNSIKYFEERLNWGIWGREMKEILDNFSPVKNNNNLI